MTSEEKNGFQREDLLASHAPNHNSLSRIDKTSTDSLFISEMQKQLDRLSSLTHSTSPFTDEATKTDGGFDSTLNRKISLSESDLLASLHRTGNKQFFDNVSEHDPADDLLFLEWDRERSLFQDYINSLRKEIHVLLQERLDSQTTTSEDDAAATKIDLLHNALEEKNAVIEQFQAEYDLLKEKNGHLTRQISLLDDDGKSHLSHIDELKQKLSDLSVDLQNHLLIKRRLELSITNLENDCKLIDAERLRLTHETNGNLHQKQNFETLLQKANVQIAEQGKDD